jgi:hypothetical protein
MATKIRQIRNLSEMLKSPEIVAVLEGIGEQVMAAAENDPNQAYVDSLRMQTFDTKDRTRVQVGAAPAIGMAVEAKRGTLARALGSAKT